MTRLKTQIWAALTVLVEPKPNYTDDGIKKNSHETKGKKFRIIKQKKRKLKLEVWNCNQYKAHW